MLLFRIMSPYSIVASSSSIVADVHIDCHHAIYWLILPPELRLSPVSLAFYIKNTYSIFSLNHVIKWSQR